jgi:probable HAF family extracellular repeat protein
MFTVRKPAFSVVLAVLSLCAAAQQSAAQIYTVTDLGTISGNSVSTGYALNNAGAVTGTSSTPTGAIAALFSDGKVTNISTLGGNVSIATAINGSVEVVGWNFFYSNPNFDPQAFLYSNGHMTSINSPSVFPSGTEALGINDSGEVVGTGYITDSNFHAFLYSGGKMTDLGPRGALQASAVAINNSGQIIGGYYLTSGGAGAFLITNGKLSTLPVPTAASAVSVFAINDIGEIAGAMFFTSGAPSHAAKFVSGIWTDLGGISGASASRATGINLSGQIVGTAFFPQTQYHPPKPGKHVPFISSSGGLVNLNTLIQSGTGLTLTDAVGINESGHILCNATNAGGSKHAVLLSPR